MYFFTYVLRICIPWSALPAEYGSIGYGCQSCSWSVFPCLRSRLRIWSPETGSAIPSRVSPLFLHFQAKSSIINLVRLLTEFLTFSATASIYLNRQPPSGQSRVNRVTHLGTDGVHLYRESTGTGPAEVIVLVLVLVLVFKVVPVLAGAAFSGFTSIVRTIFYAPLFSPTHYWVFLLIEFSHKKAHVKNPARGHKVEKHHSEGKNIVSGNDTKNSRKKRHLRINKRSKRNKNETRVAIGAPAYRRTIERRAAASAKA